MSELKKQLGVWDVYAVAAGAMDVFGRILANSGTYEVSGSTFTTRPMVAKNPNFMSGGSLTYTFEIDGDTL